MNNNNKKNQVYITTIEHKPVIHTETSEITDVKSNSNITRIEETRPLNETFLNFFIEKEASFADFDKISLHYESLAVAKYHQYNQNITIINQKKKEYEGLLLKMEQELVSFLHLTQENLESYYDNTLDSLQTIIKQKEHEVNCYNNTFKRLYKANYLIKKRLEQEMKYEQLNDAQCEKYSILKNHALLTVTKQTQMLNNVISFHEMANVKYGDSIKAKTQKYNQIDFQVVMIKKDTVEIEKHLQSYKKRQITTKQEIRKIVALNSKSKLDNLSLSKEYLKIKLKLLEIYDVLRVKGLDEIIKQFNLQRKVYQSLNSQFADANKEIAITNIELTKLIKHLKMVNREIMNKNRNIPIEYIDDYINKLNRRFAEVSSLNNHLELEIQSKNNKTKLMIVFLAIFSKKMYDSMLIPAMSYGFTVHDLLRSYEIYFSMKANDVYFNINNLQEMNYARLCLKLFTVFSYYLFLIFSNCFNTVFADQLLDLNDEYEKITFTSQKILTTYENSLRTANTDWDKKEKIFKRGEKEILTEEKANETQKRIKQRKGKTSISKEQLYMSYVKFLKEKKSNSNYIQRHPRRSILLMNKYANDLVGGTIRKKNKTDLIMSYSKILSIENQNNKESKPDIEVKENYDSYTSTPKKKKNTTRNKKEYCIKGITAYPEMDKIYSRLNDLRTLELHYFKAKDKHLVSNSNFNEIYYTFKKKILKDKNKKKVQHNRRESFLINYTKLPIVNCNKEGICNTSRTHRTSLSIKKIQSTPNNKKSQHKERVNTCTTEYLTSLTLKND